MQITWKGAWMEGATLAATPTATIDRQGEIPGLAAKGATASGHQPPFMSGSASHTDSMLIDNVLTSSGLLLIGIW